MGKGINANTQVGKQAVDLTGAETKALGFDANNPMAYVALKYLDDNHQCFSDWSTDELKAFSAFCGKISNMNWNDIYKSGGKKGSKKGLGFTKHKDKSKLPNQNVVDHISPDIDFIELRVSQKARVHGFRLKSTFFLVWLDRNHEVYAE